LSNLIYVPRKRYETTTNRHERRREGNTMKNTQTITTKRERIGSIINRMNAPTTPTSTAERIRKALAIIAPNHQHNGTRPTSTSTAERIGKAHAAPLNHRPEETAASKALFSDPIYDLARRVVAAKIKGAIRRGATADKNAYIAHYADMIQEAAKALQEAEAEAAVYTVTIPAEMEGDYYEERHSAFIEACRACGRLEKWLTSRSAKEGTPIEHISEHATTSGQERAITEREAVKDWTKRVIVFIDEQERTKAITAKQAEDMKHLMSGNADRIKQPDIVRRHLLNKLIKNGYIRRGKDGRFELVTD